MSSASPDKGKDLILSRMQQVKTQLALLDQMDALAQEAAALVVSEQARLYDDHRLMITDDKCLQTRCANLPKVTELKKSLYKQLGKLADELEASQQFSNGEQSACSVDSEDFTILKTL